MKITGPGPIRSTEVRRRTRSTGGGHERFSVETSGDQPSGLAVTPVGALASVDALLALQEVRENLDGRREAIQRGQALLDGLDEIRHGLLIGVIPRHKLQALAGAARRQKTKIDDPRLAEVLDEIELRAAVELAKFDRSA